MDKDYVTSGGGKGGKMTLIWGEAEGTSNTMQKREQRNKSLQGNAMSRYNSYKLNENIVIK